MIGLGIMGSAIAASLMRAGYAVIGYDVLSARRQAHRRAGGIVARDTPAVAARARVIICSLPSAAALLETASALATLPRGAIVVETSTLSIDVKERARQTLAARGSTLLDCPLSGTGSQARARDLVVYVSGSRAAHRRVAPVLEAFARAHHYVGPFGAGMKMKVVANLLVAVHNVATAEALLLAKKAGLDPRLALKVVGDGAGGSRVFQLRGPMMVKGDYSRPTMKLGVWEKDMKIIGELAKGVGSPTPLFSATVPVYEAAMAAGRAAEDTAAVHAVLEGMPNRLPARDSHPSRTAKTRIRGGT